VIQRPRLLKAIRLRSPRHIRTPYYMIDLPNQCVRYLIHLRTLFVETFSRDYEDTDPQFWDTSRRDKPVADPHLDTFISHLVDAMRQANHHPAHVYAVHRTQRIIHGCGSCVDRCSKCNFRDVPTAWTLEWTQATQAYEKWAPAGEFGSLITPPIVPGPPTR
jgi:ferredoxin